MAIPIWRVRPSPSRIRFVGFVFVILALFHFLLPTKIESRSSWTGPQSDTSQFFQESQKKVSFPVNDPVLSDEELQVIRDRLFSSDEIKTYNHDAFPDLTTTALLIQVHNRPQFFKVLLDSLRVAENIQSVELIISHDIYSEEMHELTSSIDFCRVSQIYFPLSASFYRDRFPADDLENCRKDEDIENCRGEQDTYGNFREARIVNIKHHWWWKLNFSALHFSHIETFVLLEEDHALMPDFVEIISQIQSFAADKNPTVRPHVPFITTLGTYKAKMTNNQRDWQTVISSSFNSGKHNMAMILPRAFVDKLRSPPMVKLFCDYDDYNWDFSLFNAVQENIKALRVYIPQIPHVFHLGDKCGLHHDKGDCSAANVDSYRKMLKDHRYFFFPPNFTNWRRATEKVKQKLKPNGGWGDLRDRNLCYFLVDHVDPSSLRLNQLPFLQ